MQKRYSNSGQLSQKDDMVTGSSRFGSGMNNQASGYDQEGGSSSAGVKTLPSIKLNP